MNRIELRKANFLDVLKTTRSVAELLPGVKRAEIYSTTGGFEVRCVVGERRGDVLSRAPRIHELIRGLK